MLYSLAAAIGGALTKIADDYSEQKVRAIHISFLAGIAYGAAIAAAVMIEPALLPLLAGATVGNIAAGKIDRKEHVIASVIILMACASQWVWDALPLAVAFACAAFADEWLHGKSGGYGGILARIIESRLALPLLCLLLAPVSLAYAVYIIIYDISYKAAGQRSRKSSA
ncbi:MAG: hypothetical protein QXU54_01295 [Candidatus Micrarchaeia archaeon]